MSDENEKKFGSTQAIVAIAGIGAAATTVIALFLFVILHIATDVGMFAVALTAIAPSAMAFGICYALIRHGKTQ